MTRCIVLDAGPLAQLTNPKANEENEACRQWLRERVGDGDRIVLPEIADCEVRRELLRANKLKGLRRLDALKGLVDYLPITTVSMLLAARLRAEARARGKPTADAAALDGDVILAAQARQLDGHDVVVATTNMGHLGQFVDARPWRDIGQSG